MKSNITKQIIAAIRQCSYVGFRLDGRETSIEIVKRAKSFGRTKFPFAQDVRVSGDVETRIEDFTKERVITGFQYKGWANEENSDYRATCVNLLGNILKENDCLVARWLISNSSEWSESKGLYCDELHIEIYRPTKKGDWKIIGSFLFCKDVGDSSIELARMVRAK